MISQHCPKCAGKRIRRGYRRTPLILRMVGIYNLLCDDCNLLFRGLAVPGTVSHHSRRRKEKSAKSVQEEIKTAR